MKRLKCLPIIMLSLIFLAMGTLIFFINDSTVSRINILSQLIYTFVTILLVGLTYKTLKLTQEQRHQEVRPYLIVSDFLVYMKKHKELDFHIYNEGPGLALNIKVKVKRSFDMKTIFENNYSRINVQDNPIYAVLCDIREEMNIIADKNVSGNKYPTYIQNSLHIEFPVEGEANENLSFIIELTYDNIYGKTYKSTFNVKFNDEDYEPIECSEKFTEL